MNALKNRNFEGVLLTDEQASCLFNLGRTTIRKLAEEAGAVRRIGRLYRIHRETLANYIETVYS